MKKIFSNNSWMVGATLLFSLSVFISCKKQDDFLAAVPVQSLAVPTTLADLKSMEQYEALFNTGDPVIGTFAGDEFYVTDATWLSANSVEQNIYIWAKDPYPNIDVADWNNSYKQVWYANTILDYLPSVKDGSSNPILYNTVKGTALFFRARAFFNLLQIFSLPYDSIKAESLAGIPLKLDADLNVVKMRSSEKDCYGRIINDLIEARSLLPSNSTVLTQPTNIAAAGFLARVYLVMGSYNNAFKYANEVLQADNSLSDFNSFKYPTSFYLTANTQYPLNEDKFHSAVANYSLNTFTKAIVDSSLYNLYDSNDLRKTAFFQVYSKGIRFKGSYEFKKFGNQYDGIATDEMYLIRSECMARNNKILEAMADIDALLIKRYKTGTYTTQTATTQDSALSIIIRERRKELAFRGLRWMDLRRLRDDTRFAKNLVRVINGNAYSLPPSDLRYAFLIPDPEIKTSGIAQNLR